MFKTVLSQDIEREFLRAIWKLPAPLRNIALSVARSHRPDEVEQYGHVFIEFFGPKCHVEVGRESYGVVRLHCYDKEGRVSIGNYTSIASLTLLVGGGHHYTDVSTYPFKSRYSGVLEFSQKSAGGIVIGSDVWIGHNVTVLDGRRIEDGAVVGAGSVIAEDIPSYAIAVGNPARVLRYRFTKSDIEILRKTRWWDMPNSVIRNNVDLFYLSDVKTFASKISEITNQAP